MTDKPLQRVAERATDSDAFEYTARAGFAVSGVLHLLVAYIILRIAFGASGNADQSGALTTLARQTGSALMLWIVAVGLVALGLWRIAEAIVGSKPGEGSGPRQDDTPAWKRADQWFPNHEFIHNPPRSRHSGTPRSGGSYSSWPLLVSPPSARTALCAVATAACSRYIGPPPWDNAV